MNRQRGFLDFGGHPFRLRAERVLQHGRWSVAIAQGVGRRPAEQSCRRRRGRCAGAITTLCSPRGAHQRRTPEETCFRKVEVAWRSVKHAASAGMPRFPVKIIDVRITSPLIRQIRPY